MPSIVQPVSDESQIGEARRAAAVVGGRAGLEAVQAGNLALIVTELATNLLRHAGGGSLILQLAGAGSKARGERPDGVEVISIDKGPGIANVEESLRDGYSTVGSAGQGLGAIKRLASRFDIYSAPRQGTVLYAEVPGKPGRGPQHPAVFGAGITVAVQGEADCGDAYRIAPTRVGFRVFVADGLGHGTFAAEAARQAVGAFDATAGRDPLAVIQTVHEALLATRGAAVAVADVNVDTGVVRYCGLGNISGAVVGATSARRMVSHNGTAGQGRPKLTEFTYPFEVGNVVVLHSDGLHSRWDPASYPGALTKHPAVFGALLYRDCERGRDDATVVTVRRAEPR